MEFDEFIPGNILYTDRFSMKTTDGVSTQLVAGNPATGGFRDGKGLFARFRTIRGFTQISKTVVVLTDYDSSCLRQIDRKTGQTSGYSGTCNDPGYQDGIPGQFFFPWSVVTDKMNKRQLFVTDHKNDALRTVHIELRAAATFVKYHGKTLLRYLTQDHNGDIFLPIADHALGRISYHDKTTKIISGSPLKAGDFQDRLSNSIFRVLEGLFFIEPTTLVVADALTNKVNLFDMNTEKVSSLTICSDCLNRPYSLLKTNNSLYIGQEGGIHLATSKYIKPFF